MNSIVLDLLKHRMKPLLVMKITANIANILQLSSPQSIAFEFKREARTVLLTRHPTKVLAIHAALINAITEKEKNQ